MKLQSKEIEELKYLVDIALKRLYDQDSLMLENSVNERSAVFRFAVYLSSLLSSSSFHGFDLDCEYNRNMGLPKRASRSRRIVIPDVLLHRRNSNDGNVLVLEFKGYWNRSLTRGNDEDKIIEFVSQNNDNDYKYGLGGIVELGRHNYEVVYRMDYDPIKL